MQMALISIYGMLLFGSVTGGSATQSDWSGGGGIPGPVEQWGQCFADASQISCTETLQLERSLMQLFETPTTATGVTLTDLNGDGNNDVLVNRLYSSKMAWFENPGVPVGSPLSWDYHEICYSNHQICFEPVSADMDNDGDMDIVVSKQYDTQYEFVYLMVCENVDGSGLVWNQSNIGMQMYEQYYISLADMDDDDDIDVVTASTYNDELLWWENGNGWQDHLIASVADASLHGPADIDLDGLTDVFYGSYYGDVIWCRNPGPGGFWVATVVDSTYSGLTDIAASDIDADGDFDLLVCSSSSPLSWLENPEIGPGSEWTLHEIDSAEYCELAAGDLDGDGDADVACASSDLNRLSWWENLDGSGTGWSEHGVEQDFSTSETSDMKAGAIYSDGPDDLVFCSYYDSLSAWNMDLFDGSGWLESSILETEAEPYWGAIDWSYSAPGSTSIAFQVRSSEDPSSMGQWSDTLSAPCSLEGILSDGDSYVQYRALLTTSQADTTPTLNEITISWNPEEVAETEAYATGSPVLFPVSPNPSPGPPEIVFSVSAAMQAQIRIFDITGRIVCARRRSCRDAGQHAIQLSDLPPGVYICRLSAQGKASLRRFVVVE